MLSTTLARWNRASTQLGLVLWLVLFAGFLRDADPFTSTELLLLLALLVIAPGALALVETDEPRGSFGSALRAALWVQPLAAGLAAASFALPTSVAAATLTLPWLLCTGLGALDGVGRLWQHRLSRIEELCIAVGLLYLPVGAVWLVLARFGARPLNFGDLIVFLTAIHFHYIPLTALLFAGLVGRRLRTLRPAVWPLYRLSALGVVGGPVLVAVGITAASTRIEAFSTLVLTTSIITLAALALFVVLPATHPRLARTLFGLSFGALFLTMPLALAYALGRWTGAWSITIPQMILGHGWVNALLFGLCGIAAWRTLASSRGG